MLRTDVVKRELLLAGGLLAVGLLPVPIAVYWVGQQVVGPYEADRGLLSLVGHIAADLIALRLSAWILVLSPYLIVQLLRAAAYIRRQGRDETSVTDSE